MLESGKEVYVMLMPVYPIRFLFNLFNCFYLEHRLNGSILLEKYKSYLAVSINIVCSFIDSTLH